MVAWRDTFIQLIPWLVLIVLTSSKNWTNSNLKKINWLNTKKKQFQEDFSGVLSCSLHSNHLITEINFHFPPVWGTTRILEALMGEWKKPFEDGSKDRGGEENILSFNAFHNEFEQISKNLSEKLSRYCIVNGFK